MIIIDKNSEEYLQNREFYRRMFEKTIKAYEGLLNFDVDQLLDLGRMKINGLYVKDDLNFSNSVLDLGDLGKLFAATTIFRRPNEKAKNVVDPRAREEIADTMLDLIPDCGYYYSPLMTSVLGKKYHLLHENSELVKQIYASYGLIYSDEGINYGDAIMGIIAVKRFITLYEDYRTLTYKTPKDKNDKEKREKLEELRDLATSVLHSSRTELKSGTAAFKGLLDKPLNKKEQGIFDKETGRLIQGPGPGVSLETARDLNPLIAKIYSDAPMSEVFAAVREFGYGRILDFIEYTRVEEKDKMIRDFDKTLSIDDVEPRLAAAYYYLQMYEELGPSVLRLNGIHFEDKKVWATIWKDYEIKGEVAKADKAIMRCLNGPYWHLKYISDVEGWTAEDQVFTAEASLSYSDSMAGKERKPIPEAQLEKLAITCSLLNNGNVELVNKDKSVDARYLIELAYTDKEHIQPRDYRYIIRRNK